MWRLMKLWPKVLSSDVMLHSVKLLTHTVLLSRGGGDGSAHLAEANKLSVFVSYLVRLTHVCVYRKYCKALYCLMSNQPGDAC